MHNERIEVERKSSLPRHFLDIPSARVSEDSGMIIPSLLFHDASAKLQNKRFTTGFNYLTLRGVRYAHPESQLSSEFTSILEMPQTSIPDVLHSVIPSFMVELATPRPCGYCFYLILYRPGTPTLKTL